MDKKLRTQCVLRALCGTSVDWSKVKALKRNGKSRKSEAYP